MSFNTFGHSPRNRLALAVVFAPLMVAGLPVYAATVVGRTPAALDVSRLGELGYTIPLEVPRGVKGLAPRIALTYEHRRGATYAGVGWTLSGLSQITRCPRTTAQDGTADAIRLDTTDRFCLDGNRLRPENFSTTYGAAGTSYRLQVDTVARVTIPSVGTGGDPQWFKVEQKNGLIYEYGNSVSSRIESTVPGKTSIAFVWTLTAIRDRDGNSIVFTYQEDGSPNGGYRIQKIEYTSNVIQGTPPPYRVDFSYQAKPATDYSSAGQYVAGSNVREVNRLTQVAVTHAPSATLVRRYDLAYEPALSNTNVSRLASITECAGAVPDCFPATTFTYQNGTAGVGAEVLAGTAPVNPLSIDINGDGRVDLVYSSSTTSGGGTWMYQLANSSGGFNAAVNSGISNTNYSFAAAIDYDEDGKDDLIVPYNGTTWWVIHGSASGLQAPVNTAAAWATNRNGAGVDFNGDGREDLLWWQPGAYGIFVQYRNSSGPGFGTAVRIDNVSAGTPTYLSTLDRKNRRRHIDVNGDGIQDVPYTVLTGSFATFTTNSFVLLGGGKGTWTVFVAAGTSAANYFGDFNGDGFTDVAYSPPSGILTYRMSTGTTFAPAVGLTSVTGTQVGRLIRDWDGDGLQDLLVANGTSGTWDLYRSNGSGLTNGVSTGVVHGNPSYVTAIDTNGDGLDDIGYIKSGGPFAVRPRAGSTPDLLNSVSDGYGNVANISYVSTAQSAYTSGGIAPVFPNREFIGPLIVVQQLARSNGIGGLRTTTYSYTAARLTVMSSGQAGLPSSMVNTLPNASVAPGLRAGLTEAGTVNQTAFKGFGSMVETDSVTQLVTVSDYSVDDPPLLGMLVGKRLYQSNGTTAIGLTTVTPDKVAATNGDTLRGIPYPKVVTTTEYEFGGAYNGALKRTVTRTIGSIDQYGTPTSMTQSATEPASGANGIRPGATYSVTTTLSGFQDSAATWCLGKPGTVTSQASHNQWGGGTITRTLARSWDSTSACRLNSETVEPGSTAYQLTRDLLYDVYGNVRSESLTGRKNGTTSETRTSLYDFVTGALEPGRFLIKVTNPENEITTFDWQAALGIPSKETDPNGIFISWQYDPFGRVQLESRSVDGTSTTWSYNDCSAVSGGCIANNKMVVIQTERNASGATVNDLWTYFDKWERIVSRSTRTLDGSYDRNDREYNAQGLLKRVAAPCRWSSCSYYWTEYTYDPFNRVMQIQRPRSDVDPTLVTTSFAYEALATRITDGESKQHFLTEDARGQKVRSADHLGYAVISDFDAFGALKRVTDSQGATFQETNYVYGASAFRTSVSDYNAGTSTPGTWSYSTNAFGDLYGWSDPKGQAFSATFDRLSRMRTRTDSTEGVTSSFEYGTSAVAKNVGQLTSVSGYGYTEAYTYEPTTGRLSQVQVSADATNYFFNFSYDAQLGTLGTLTYPQSTSGCRLQVTYGYQYGQLVSVTDSSGSACGSAGTNYWTATQVDAANRVTRASRGSSSSITNLSFDAVTGWLRSVTTGVGGGAAQQNNAYAYNKVGALIQRQDNRLPGLTENFSSDSLYRLDTSTLNAVTNLDVDYDVLGRITKKTDVAASGTWAYDSSRRFQLLNAAGAVTYSYDANGNVGARNGQPLNWTSFNYLSAFTQGGASNQFVYGPNRERWKQVYTDPSGTETTRTLGQLLETVTTSSGTDYRHWVVAGGQTVALSSRKTFGAQPNTLRFPLHDHQGNISGFLRSDGTLDFDESYTAFGVRRNGTTWQLAPGPDLAAINAVSARGYTEHTHVRGSSLIHMNGRVMDAETGRFLSLDPLVGSPLRTQAWDPYRYVYNAPMDHVDPSGMCDSCGPPIDGGFTQSPPGAPNGPTLPFFTLEQIQAWAERQAQQAVLFNAPPGGGVDVRSGGEGTELATIGLPTWVEEQCAVGGCHTPTVPSYAVEYMFYDDQKALAGAAVGLVSMRNPFALYGSFRALQASSRATELWAMLPHVRALDGRTVAVARLRDGRVLVAGSGTSNLTRAQIAALRSNEVYIHSRIGGQAGHAEAKIFDWLNRNGGDIQAMGTSRHFCPTGCTPKVLQNGGTILPTNQAAVWR